MYKIDIKVGFACNNRCRFCIAGDKRYIYPQKPTEEILRILRQGQKENAEGVVFTGGEPTLRKEELLIWLKYAKELGYRSIQVQTNGRMFFYLDFCKEAIEAGANEFGISIHASNSKIHDFLTQNPGSFDQTIQAIKNLKSLGARVLTNTVITKYNFKDLPNVAKMLVFLKVDQYQLAFLHIGGIILQNSKLIKKIVPRFFEVMPYVKKGLQIGIRSKVKCMTEAIPYCLMQGYEDYIAEKNLPEAHIFDANWEIKKFSEYRKKKGKAKGPNCKSCKYDRICEGTWKEYPQIFGWEEFKPIWKEEK